MKLEKHNKNTNNAYITINTSLDALDVIVLESSVENGVEKGILYRSQTSLEP